MDDDVGDGMFESLKCNNATYLQHLHHSHHHHNSTILIKNNKKIVLFAFKYILRVYDVFWEDNE